MSVTFSGAFTFNGGGLTLTMAPTGATAGWYGGGKITTGTPISSVSRITYATDTDTASNRGTLSAARYSLGGTGNLTYGWFGGGYKANAPTTAYSIVDRITYSTDTATASVRGPLNQSIFDISAAGTSTDGWFIGGYSPAAPSGARSTVIRITYATDTATGTAKANLPNSAWDMTALTDTTTYGWCAGGQPGSGAITTVNRIIYATDTASPTSRGPLTSATQAAGSTYTTAYGWVGGSPGSTVQRITYATDTATASVRGPIYTNNYNAGSGNDTYGWFGGGENAGAFLTTVYRITYATDTAAATARGPLFSISSNLAATSGQQ